MTDLLGRDKSKRMTFVADAPGRDVREAVLDYRVLECKKGTSLVSVSLKTGRTHQIRVQFSSRGMPLLGDRKYGIADDAPSIALWSSGLAFRHPKTDERMELSALPQNIYPWSDFEIF